MQINSILSQIKAEEKRNQEFLHLTANEAQMSETARMFLGSKLSERYYIGGGERSMIFLNSGLTAVGFPGIEKLITEAEQAACEMLQASAVNLNCLSGVHAMMCSILSTTEAGDTVMTVEVPDGGHFATAGILQRVGRRQVFAEYDLPNLRFDVEKTAKIFKESGAKAFYMDVSYYVNPHNLREIRKALGDEAIIIYDASHTMGLILGGEFQSPLTEGADVISANTHKTLPGPQKGMIAFKDQELASKANAIIDGCLYSSPHTHHLIALAVTLLEMKEFGVAYAQQVVRNSNALAEALVKLGLSVRKSNTGNYSENHQVHLFTKEFGSPRGLYKTMFANRLAVNFSTPLGGKMFIRIGTQEITRRGMKEKEMQKIARFLKRSLEGKDVQDEVMELNRRFRGVEYSFDG